MPAALLVVIVNVAVAVWPTATSPKFNTAGVAMKFDPMPFNVTARDDVGPFGGVTLTVEVP